MNQPEIYLQVNQKAVGVTSTLLNKYFNVVEWKQDKSATVLDIGSGPGDVTRNLLYPRCKNYVKSIIGVDIYPAMVNYANKFNSNGQIVFEVFDVASKKLPIHFQENFDYVFSFWSLHWVRDQWSALTNIWKMMKPGGEMLVDILIYSTLFDYYKNVRKHSTWKSYLSDEDYGISPYQNLTNAKEVVLNLLKSIGFEVRLCELEEIDVYYNILQCKELLIALHPFYHEMPKALQDDFLNDHIEQCKGNYSYDKDNSVCVKQKFLIIHAQKK